MSEFSAKTIREARKAKASRMGSADPHTKVDSSDWTPPEPLNADIKTGARPLSRRAFKSGGKVAGQKAKANMGRKPRCGGGKAGEGWVNRNVKEANEEREGKKHIGGFKKGGRTAKADGGEMPKNPPLPPRRRDYFPEEGKEPEASDLYTADQIKRLEAGRKAGGRTKKMDGGMMGMPMGDSRLGMVQPTRMKFTGAQGSPYKKGGKVHEDEAADKALIKKMVKAEARTGRATGGRTRAKGKTNINIIIAAGKGQPQDGGPGTPPGLPGGPMSLQRPMGPPPSIPGMPAGGLPGGPPSGPPAMGQPPMPPMARKSGGRVSKVASSYKDMEAGAASGEGRLQKTDIAKRIPKKREDGVIETDKRGYPNKVIGATGGRTAHKAGGKVYRSYKDMDAGAGSGEGRLEKTEIAKKKAVSRPHRFFGGRAAEEAMVKAGVSPNLAANPNYMVAYGLAGGNRPQADFNYRAMQFLGMGTGGPFIPLEGEGEGGGAPASMNPTAGLKAILPGARANGGKVVKKKR